MKTNPATANDIDQYIAGFPPEVRKILQKIRLTIRKAAPDAKEAIKYQMPTFTLNGNLIHFAAFTHHIGLYPAPNGIDAFKKELARYGGGKGSVRFPLDEPIPYGLIDRITKFRVRKQKERGRAKRKK